MWKNDRLLSVQVFVSICILLFTVLDDIAVSKLNDFNNKQILQGNSLNSQRLDQIETLLNQEKFEIYAMIGTPRIDFKTGELKRTTNIQREINTIPGCDSQNVSDRVDCANKIVNLLRKDGIESADSYNEKAALVNNEIESGSPWSFWHRLFKGFQIFFSLSIIFISRKLLMYDRERKLKD